MTNKYRRIEMDDALQRAVEVFDSWQSEEYDRAEKPDPFGDEKDPVAVRRRALIRGGMLAEVIRELKAFRAALEADSGQPSEPVGEGLSVERAWYQALYNTVPPSSPGRRRIENAVERAIEAAKVAGIAEGRRLEREKHAVANTLMELVHEWIHANKPSCSDSLYQMDRIEAELPDLAERCCDTLGYFMVEEAPDAD